uniref:Ovule protein n=1 Tax=Elaeophora elaphi TaxID=1147741 RepID=A0A0R3RPV8_9BILA
MSLNSTSSKNSSCSATASHPRARALSALTFQHTMTANRRFHGGTVQPPSSPHVRYFLTFSTVSLNSIFFLFLEFRLFHTSLPFFFSFNLAILIIYCGVMRIY